MKIDRIVQLLSDWDPLGTSNVQNRGIVFGEHENGPPYRGYHTVFSPLKKSHIDIRVDEASFIAPFSYIGNLHGFNGANLFGPKLTFLGLNDVVDYPTSTICCHYF